ncbi:MAG: hypothetical protein VW270_31230 [Candidatus Poseidoniales archaeon]
MENKLSFNEFYQSNKFAVNAVIGLGVLTLLTLGGIAVAKALRGPANNEENEEEEEQGGGYGGVIPGPETGTGQATISNTKATSLAAKLYDAMEACGTYEYMIEDVFDELETPADVNLVVQKFGVRNYGTFMGCGGNTYSWYGEDGDLAYWMRQEVNCEDVGDVCSKMAAAGYVV